MKTTMKKMQKGFSLVELLVVVAIIAILAAVSIPMYSNYTTKAKITGVLATVGQLKANVAEENTSIVDGALTAGALAVTGTTVNDSGTIYKIDVAVNSGQIHIFFTAPTAAVGQLKLTPTIVGNGASIKWACTSSNMSQDVLPSSCTGV